MTYLGVKAERNPVEGAVEPSPPLPISLHLIIVVVFIRIRVFVTELEKMPKWGGRWSKIQILLIHQIDPQP